MSETKTGFGIASAFFSYIVVGLILLLQYRLSFSMKETELFVVLMTAYIWMGALLVYAKFRFNLNIFEPITFVSALYLAIFVLKPIADLSGSGLYAHGKNVLDGGVKATLIMLLSYTALYISYYGKQYNFKWTSSKNGRCVGNYTDTHSRPVVLNNTVFLYVVWCVSFIFCIICMLSQGVTIRYLFSFGNQGEKVVDESNTALLFLSNFGITLITAWLLIIIKSRRKLIKLLLTVLTIEYLLMRNGRWLILVMILAPVTYYYLHKRKKPNMIVVAGGAVIMLMIFAWMQVNRATLAAGGAMQGWGDEGLTLEILLSPLESDLGTYKTFYAMVMNYPSLHEYMLGTTFLYTVVMFVPRAIWQGKPDNPVRDMIQNSLGMSARESGTAVANIGEMYANFGIVGCVVLMVILGKAMLFMKKSLMVQSDDRLIMYALLYPLQFQWIARGNFSGNFYMTIFALLPFIIEKMFKVCKWGKV